MWRRVEDNEVLLVKPKFSHSQLKIKTQIYYGGHNEYLGFSHLQIENEQTFYKMTKNNKMINEETLNKIN